MQPDATNFPLFWYFINERTRISLKKKAGEPWPWTDDPILQTYKFTHCFREWDKVTVQLNEIFKSYRTSNPLVLLRYWCLARQINWPDTVAELVLLADFPLAWHPGTVYNIMMARRARGEKLYTGAYMLRGDIQNGTEDNNKPKYTVYKVLDPVFKAYPQTQVDLRYPFNSIQECTEWLASFHGWGGFLAYEVATDLRHTYLLDQAPDIMTWANAGPGAIRGLNRIFGRPVKAALSQEQALEEMRWLLAESPKYLEPHVPALEAREIEHSGCEYDKWMRVKLGEGRPRSKYRQAPTRERKRS